MSTHGVLTFTMLALAAVTAVAYEVSVLSLEGNAYITRPDGERRQITSTGKDYDPSLSPDGKYIVFARAVEGPALPLASQPRPQTVPRSELWIAAVDGGSTQRLFSGEVKEKEFRYVNFFKPQLSPDNRWVYFLIPYAAVSDAVVRLDRKTLQTKILTPAEQFSVLKEGRYKGFLVVQKRVQEDEGVSLPFWLVSPDGEPIRKIATTEAGAKRFIEQQR